MVFVFGCHFFPFYFYFILFVATNLGKLEKCINQNKVKRVLASSPLSFVRLFHVHTLQTYKLSLTQAQNPDSWLMISSL